MLILSFTLHSTLLKTMKIHLSKHYTDSRGYLCLMELKQESGRQLRNANLHESHKKILASSITSSSALTILAGRREGAATNVGEGG